MPLKRYRFLFAAIFVLLGPAQTAAHHSTALFVVRVTEFHGELVEIDWRNPHVHLSVKVQIDQGNYETVVFMADNIKNLEHAGLRHEMLKLGETVDVSGRRSGRDKHKVLGQSIAFENGSEFNLWLGG